jgi:hypothetical protein
LTQYVTLKLRKRGEDVKCKLTARSSRIVPNENSVKSMADAIAPSETQSFSSSGTYSSLVNEIC